MGLLNLDDVLVLGMPFAMPQSGSCGPKACSALSGLALVSLLRLTFLHVNASGFHIHANISSFFKFIAHQICVFYLRRFLLHLQSLLR